MKVSMNGLRKTIANDFDALAEKYNSGEPITEELDNLKNSIGCLLCVYDSDNPDFVDMSDRDLTEVRYDNEKRI